jgi:hypothetical protein
MKSTQNMDKQMGMMQESMLTMHEQMQKIRSNANNYGTSPEKSGGAA